MAHPPWLTTRLQAYAGSASQGKVASASPPVRDGVVEEVTRGVREREQVLENIRYGEQVIEEFFGQLWAIDSPPPWLPRVRPLQPPPNRLPRLLRLPLLDPAGSGRVAAYHFS
jgi:hypothetical protein